MSRILYAHPEGFALDVHCRQSFLRLARRLPMSLEWAQHRSNYFDVPTISTKALAEPPFRVAVTVTVPDF
jgi:hypothetical protein